MSCGEALVGATRDANDNLIWDISLKETGLCWQGTTMTYKTDLWSDLEVVGGKVDWSGKDW